MTRVPMNRDSRANTGGRYLARAGLLLLLVLLITVGCARVKDTTPPPTPLESFQAEVRLSESWSAGTGNAFNKHWVQLDPLISGDRIFTANVGGQVTAFDLGSGSRLWRAEAGAWLSAGIGGDDGQVYAGTQEGELVAWSMDDGGERWRRHMRGELLATPMARDGRLIVRTADGRVVSLHPRDGARRWSHSHSVPPLSLRGGGRPVIVAGGVLVGQSNGRVVALADDDGNALWEVAVGDPAGRTPIERMIDIDGLLGIGHGSVFAASYQGEIARIDPARGQIRWSREMSSYRGMTVDSDRVYVTDAAGHVHALSPDDGSTHWRQERLAWRGLTAPIPVPDTPWLVLADMEGYIHLLARSDGRIVGRYRTGRWGIMAEPVVDDEGRIFVQTRGARLYAFEARALD